MSDDDGYFYEDDSDAEGDESLRGSDLDFNTAAELEDTFRQVLEAQYVVYTEEQLRERKKRSLAEVTSVLSIPDADAIRVLRLFKWDVNRVKEEWFTDMDSLKEKIGLIETLPPPESASKPRGRSKRAKCGVCFEEYLEVNMRSTGCRHMFCKDCWRGYITAAVEAGPGVLDLRCPVPDCNAAVPAEVLEEVCSADEIGKIRQFALRSYVEDSRKLTWCPAPGCEHAVECTADIGAEPLDVTCNCGSTFCFTCKEEAHRPVDCETVATWIRKNSAESENLNWILANTKPCPKCKRPIEKNQGCMHMSCSQCKFEFCWLCLAPWKEHGEATGGFYACNRYEAGKKEGKFTEEEAKREHAKHSLERYMHYYQRWNENDKSRVKAQQKMAELQGSKLENLSEITATPTSQLKFITDAWCQVVECRRILKWTYAYGYYSFQPAEERRKGSPPAATKEQQGFFEFNQGQAESYLERLHKMVENDLNEFIEGAMKVDAWAKWRENLIGLTDVTRSHFDKLVMELEKGLDAMLADYQNDVAIGMDVEEDEASVSAAEAGLSGVARGSAVKKPRTRTRTVGKRNRAAKGSASTSAADSNNGIDVTDVDGAWQCRHCTYANTEADADVCEVCEQGRYS